MAGHSQYANIKHRKGAQDAKKAKKFTKLRRELVVAARSGIPDPAFNPRLRSALANARRQGLPKDKIEAAFKSASNKTDADDYQEIYYMASGSGEMWPNGISVVVDALTNNKNRTASEVRHILSKFGFVFAELSFMFDRLGLFSYAESVDLDRLIEFALEIGALDVKKENKRHNVYSNKEDFSRIADELSKEFGDCEYSGLVWVPKSPQIASKEVQQNLEKMLEALEENDDVQNVYTSISLED
ncbi:DNA-binding regulatory, YebC/PmpR family protein [Neorickettsia helminthoeca str. Oregon]|uniref:Probable transcriptional regulatory protein NHE_0613 n=1 Tax=Neorickettsia helminthoeca str. Oregon TaxID=1286528 RepID=X5H4E9_9RICK|nr:YebC/PmpR family DNA-binding transcriptional regulator [Neorickettsia helminthoeca]AHX11548.1 DNA-binding regulatory, YebC/PmpR family protein [Neorickettsia helminthoeca str. Oregon]